MYKISEGFAQKMLREGWFDKLASFFKKGRSSSSASKKIADAWIAEKEIDIGEDLSDETREQIYQFVESRYERALKVYEDSDNPVRKAVFAIVRLLDKKIGPIVDRSYSNQIDQY